MGLLVSLLSESFPPPSKFSIDDIPNLSGKVVIVTGANSGIGKETVKALLIQNAKVYAASRDQEKGEETVRDLRSTTGKDAHFLKLDLADLKAVKRAATEFLSKEKELHILFNNAGVMVPPIDFLTADGYDLQFGTNVLGHFYLTKLLLPALLAAAQTSPDGKSRVINVSSSRHLLSGLDFNTFKDGPARRNAGTQQLYSQSKTGVVVAAAEWARRYGNQGIVSTSLNPGNLRTGIQRNLAGFRAYVTNLYVYDGSYGALTQLWAGTSAEGAGFNGKYLIPWARIGSPRADTQDPSTGKALWDWMEEQVKDI